MESTRALLLQVWQEACRHIEIGELTPTIAELVVRELPVEQLLVRRLHREERHLETVGVGFTDRWGDAPGRTPCTEEEAQRLVSWTQEGRVLRQGQEGAEAGLIRLLADPVLAANPLCVPLYTAPAEHGALVLAASAGRAFAGRDEALARALAEPFAVALENDRRVRELQQLRSAAEEDRRSLLTRLGRENLGDTIVGTNSGLKEVMRRVDLVARSNAPVLILGESGSGKELIARAIHGRSPRRAGAFLRVNCGAIPPELIDSQLFGHEKGAFTDAVSARQGWFERADGGTMFLDEIGELPPPAQVRLLRVLQDGWLERVGGQRAIHVDVRIVAATNRDLASMVSRGRFREDLWYRIAVFPILLPPLRERPQDIPSLARHFAERAARRLGLRQVLPTEEDIHLLQGYDWPGNIREFSAVIDRAAILGDGQNLEVAKALGAEGLALAAPHPRPARPPSVATAEEPPLAPLAEAMRSHIEKALRLSEGRVEGPCGAAALLQINPHTLRARMRKLGIPWSEFRRRPEAGRCDQEQPPDGKAPRASGPRLPGTQCATRS